jgi:hypothetical protein
VKYKREVLYHLIIRALQRNTFTAQEPIKVVLRGHNVLLRGSVSHPDLIPEAVATVEAVAPFLNVHSRLRVRGQRIRA